MPWWLMVTALSHAEDGDYTPPPPDRLWYSNSVFVRVNPLGLIDAYRIGWRHRLSTSDSVLLRDHPELRGSLWPYLGSADLLRCPVGRRANDRRVAGRTPARLAH